MKNLSVIFILFVVFSTRLIAADANLIVTKLVEKADKVNNYKADVLIKVNFDFIKIEDRKAKVVFEKPDKFSIDAEGFAMLPKNSTEMEYINILKKPHTAIVDRNEKLNGKNLTVVKIIPAGNDGTSIILAELWVDVQRNLLIKLNAFTKDEGNYNAEFTYAKHPYDLPDKVKFNFEVKNPNIPSYMTGDMETKKLPKTDEKSTGSVMLIYSNYIVNYK